MKGLSRTQELSTKVEMINFELRCIVDNMYVLSKGIDCEVDNKVRRNALLVLVNKQQELCSELKEVAEELMCMREKSEEEK